MMVHLSRERRTIFFVCYQFFKRLRDRYDSRKSVFTDGVHWYNDACRWLRLQHQVYGTELKNIMERFIHQHVKDNRTECFDDHFSLKPDCDRQNVWNWLKLFMLYLRTGMNRNKFTTFLARDGG
jgi:putative transposase